MSIIGTFNGWNVVAVPAAPGLRSISFAMTDSIAASTSPFSLTSQYYQWAGADLWSGQASLPEMTPAQAAPWIAFLMELRGRLNVFSLGDPLRTQPQGNPLAAAGGAKVDASNAGYNTAGSQTLYTDGWLASRHGLLLPGDYIQIGYRLYAVLDEVNSDANGKAQIAIWPSIREQPTAVALTLTGCTGLFRLADNKREWSVDYTRVAQVSFKFVEAR